MTSRRIRRRRYLIDRNLQGRYVLQLFLIALAGSLVLSGLLALATGDTFTIVYENSFLHLGRTREVLLDRFLAAFWFLLVFGGGLVVLAAVVLSHRFAGPLRKIEGTLAEMAAGDFSKRITLRQGDEGQAVAARLNALADRLTLSFEAVEQLLAETERLLETSGGVATVPPPDEEPPKATSSVLFQIEETTRRVHQAMQPPDEEAETVRARLHEVRQRLRRFLPKGI